MSWESFHVTDLNETPFSCSRCQSLQDSGVLLKSVTWNESQPISNISKNEFSILAVQMGAPFLFWESHRLRWEMYVEHSRLMVLLGKRSRERERAIGQAIEFDVLRSRWVVHFSFHIGGIRYFWKNWNLNEWRLRWTLINKSVD